MESFDNSNMDEFLRQKVKDAALEYFDFISSKSAPKKYVPASGKKIGKEELCNMIEASLDMWLTAGRFNDQFEKDFAAYLGVPFALSTNSGSSANLLALSALTSHKLGDRRLKKGDEVITVAAGFPTTVNPIIQQGLVPVFVDCEIGTYNINASQIEAALTSKTKAIFVAHTLGNMFDMQAILDICKKHNLWLIEDSCDALGAQWNGKKAGTIGHIGTFSFYPAHHMTMGEGGAVVMLEEYEHAKARGAKIYAEVVGYGCTNDAYHMTAPNPEAVASARAIELAAKEGGVTADGHLYINAHGTGTPLNDKTETAAIKRVFGQDAYKLHVSSTKSMTGHMLGAAGGVEAIASVLALDEGVIPPTINYKVKDEECDLDITPNAAAEAELTFAMSTSLGFGGHNGCLAFKKI